MNIPLLKYRTCLLAVALALLPRSQVQAQAIVIPPERLTDIAKGALSSNPANFTIIDSRVFFTASDSHGRRGLYVKNLVLNDGSLDLDLWTVRGHTPKLLANYTLPAGVTDLDEFATTETNGLPRSGKVYFHVPGKGLYMSSGRTPVSLGRFDNAATHDQVTSMISVQASSLTPFVYFGGWMKKTGQELYRSAGTARTTKIVDDIVTGTDSSNPDELTELPEGQKSTIFFRATPTGSTYPQIWTTQTTGTGAAPVLTSTTGAPTDLVSSGDINGCYFVMPSGTSNGVTELWSTPSTPGNAVQETTTKVGPLGLTVSAENGQVLFSGADSVNGRQLWGCDSGGAGLLDVLSPNGNANPNQITDAAGMFFYAATAPNPADSNNPDVLLFQTDGGQGDSVLIDNITDTNTYYPMNPTEITPVVDNTGNTEWVYFIADGYVDDANGFAYQTDVLWMVPNDGSSQDASPVLDANGFVVTGAHNLRAVVNSFLGYYGLFFARDAGDGFGDEVWVTAD